MLKPGRPRHEQISDLLREQIQQGHFQPNEQLPSESQLGEQFDVSRITVRRALQTLEHTGFIYRRQGLGSFVSETQVRQGLVRLTDFVEDMQQAGLEASSQVLHFDQESASPEVARALDLEEGKVVARLDRLRLGNEEPIAFDQTWLPVFYAQLLDGRDLTRQTIYHILKSEYDIPILRGRFRIEAVNAGAEIAELLNVPQRRALLLIERISFTTGDRRVYFQRRYYRSDRVAYELELERDQERDTSPSNGMPLQEFEPVFKQQAGG
ncbi:MAG TPA: GntR family transcriptional regulator [Rhodothermales bacterium]|nr:GntR family transcriptional regulator [Rhodothermales bacterium]